MSLRVVGVVALAGLTAVAAYILLFRKKDEETADEPREETVDEPQEETVDEPKEETLQTPEKEPNDDFEHVEVSVTSEEVITEIETIGETKTNNKSDITEKKNYEAAEDFSSKTESLMEWIDRQLKEAESKSRNVTPDPDTKLDQSASPDPDSSKNLANNNYSNRMESDTTIDEVPPTSTESIVIEDKQENEDSIEIIEFEKETIQEKNKYHNAQEVMESLEIGVPQQSNDDTTVKCIPEEQSIEIIETKLWSNIHENITYENSQAAINEHDAHPNAESESSLESDKCLTDFIIESNQMIEEQQQLHSEANNNSSIEFINLSMSDINLDINTNKTQMCTEKEIEESNQINLVETDDLDSCEENVLGDEQLSEQNKGEDVDTADADVKIANYADAECSKISQVDEDSDAEIQLLKDDSEKRISNMLEDSEDSENESEPGSTDESVNTEIAVSGAKSDEDSPEVNVNSEKDSKDELNDSIGLILRPSWQMKKPLKNQKSLDEKLTSI